MSSNQMAPLFGGHTPQQGQKIKGSLVGQTKREMEQVTVSAEVAAMRKQGHAFLALQALTTVATLVSQVEGQMKIAPAVTQIYEAISIGYVIGVGYCISREAVIGFVSVVATFANTVLLVIVAVLVVWCVFDVLWNEYET